MVFGGLLNDLIRGRGGENKSEAASLCTDFDVCRPREDFVLPALVRVNSKTALSRSFARPRPPVRRAVISFLSIIG